LRQTMHLDGLPLNLVDTAGLRTTVDVVEAEGVRRARGEIARADRVLYLVDAQRLDAQRTDQVIDWPAELALLPKDVPVTLVFNKIDLTGRTPRIEADVVPPRVFLSARTGAGMELLRSYLKDSVGYRDVESGALSARRRHLHALSRAAQLVQHAADTLKTTRAFELFAEDLRLAQRALGEITGEFTSEDLLDEIFGSFCIGK